MSKPIYPKGIISNEVRKQTIYSGVTTGSSNDLLVLTWNIDGLNQDSATSLRLDNIIKILRETSADIICLQEVVPSAHCRLSNELKNNYHMQSEDSIIGCHYYTVILIRKSTMHIVREASRDRYLMDGESSMGRDILSCVVRRRNNTVDILILTTHLESGTEPRAVNTRANQYRQVLRRLVCLSDPNDYSSHARILCGDFNLREDEDSEVRNNLEDFGSSFYDAHTVTSSPHPYTWKRKYPLSKYPAQARFDRQIYSGSISNCSYSLVGCESIPEMNELLVKSCGYRTPSDHFGVLCRYQLLGIIQQVLSISSSPLVPEDTYIGRPTKQICLRPPEVVDLT